MESRYCNIIELCLYMIDTLSLSSALLQGLDCQEKMLTEAQTDHSDPELCSKDDCNQES